VKRRGSVDDIGDGQSVSQNNKKIRARKKDNRQKDEIRMERQITNEGGKNGKEESTRK
jgi:hypothetical protein